MPITKLTFSLKWHFQIKCICQIDSLVMKSLFCVSLMSLGRGIQMVSYYLCVKYFVNKIWPWRKALKKKKQPHLWCLLIACAEGVEQSWLWHDRPNEVALAAPQGKTGVESALMHSDSQMHLILAVLWPTPAVFKRVQLQLTIVVVLEILIGWTYT